MRAAELSLGRDEGCADYAMTRRPRGQGGRRLIQAVWLVKLVIAEADRFAGRGRAGAGEGGQPRQHGVVAAYGQQMPTVA